MTFLVSDDGGLLTDGNGVFLCRPDPTIAVPEVIVVGQARPVDGRYIQAVIVPTPADGLAWRAWREGEQPIEIKGDGPKDIDVGSVSAPVRPTVVYLVSDDGRVSNGYAIPAAIPNPQPIGVTGEIAITSTPVVGGPLTVVFPEVTFGTPPSPPTRQLRVYTAEGDAEPDPALTLTLTGDTTDTLPATYPPEWSGLPIDVHMRVPDLANPRGYQDFASPRQVVAPLPVVNPPTLADITIFRSDARGPGHSPILALSLAMLGRQIQWRASDGPWFDVEPNPGGAANQIRLRDSFDPLYPTVNAAIFYPGPPVPARNGRLRFRVLGANGVWSEAGPLMAVPNPTVVVPDPDPGVTPNVDIIVNSEALLASAIYATTSSGAPRYRVIAVAARSTPYGAVSLSGSINRSVADTAYIVPADYNNPPTFSEPWGLNGKTGVHVNGMRFVNTEGEGPGAYTNTDGETKRRYLALAPRANRTAVNVQSSTRIAFTNCYFDFWDIIARGDGCRQFRFEYNTMERTGMDGFRLYGNCNFTVRGNRSVNPIVDVRRASEDRHRHCDWLQLACGRTQTGSYDYLIEDNYVVGVNGYYQCLLMLNERCVRNGGDSSGTGGFAFEPSGRGDISRYGHRNGIVRGNEMFGGHIAGMYVAGCWNLLAEANMIRPFSSDVSSGNKPATCLLGRNTGVIRDHVSSGGDPQGFAFLTSGSGATSGPRGTLAEIDADRNTKSDSATNAAWRARHPGGLLMKTGQYGYNGGVPTAVIP